MARLLLSPPLVDHQRPDQRSTASPLPQAAAAAAPVSLVARARLASRAPDSQLHGLLDHSSQSLKGPAVIKERKNEDAWRRWDSVGRRLRSFLLHQSRKSMQVVPRASHPVLPQLRACSSPLVSADSHAASTPLLPTSLVPRLSHIIDLSYKIYRLTIMTIITSRTEAVGV